MIQLPLIGGFNDGKFIEPKGRSLIKMAKPPAYDDNSISHYEAFIGFEYEIYNLESIALGGKKFSLFVIEGMTLIEVLEKLILGYKQFNKRKGLDLTKT